jgi:hypothetical protein
MINMTQNRSGRLPGALLITAVARITKKIKNGSRLTSRKSRLSDRVALGRQIVLGFAFVVLSAASSQAGFVTFESAGANAAAITPTRDAFRTAVGGGTVAGANGSFGGVRREINWDGVPDAKADPNPLPANFFNSTSPRGLEYSTPGTGFLVSANAGLATPPLFGFPNDFATFSPQRLFTAVNSNIVDNLFFVPGTSIAAGHPDSKQARLITMLRTSSGATVAATCMRNPSILSDNHVS